MKNFSKKLLILLVLMLIAITAMTAFACGEEEEDTNPTPSQSGKIVVLQDGDNILKMLDDISELSEYIPTISDPSLGFYGWYVDKALSQEYDGSQDVSTLYAKWIKKTFTVKFLNYDGTVLPVNGNNTQIIEYGESAIAPETPTKPGVEFTGWNVPFDNVTSNLTVMATFSSEPQFLTFYAEDGTEIFSQKFVEGTNVTSYFNAQLVRAEELLPGGIEFDTWCTDEAREVAFTETDEIIMSSAPLTLYARAKMKNIEQLKIIPSRNDFRYDRGGFDLVADFLDYKELQYNYKWYKANKPGEILYESNSATFAVPCQDAGEHVFVVEVTASYKNYAPKVSVAEGIINIELGKLEGISVEGNEVNYTGTNHTIVVNGTFPDDSITYRRKGETSYSDLPIKDAGEYEIETRVERKNYEPIEFTANEFNSKILKINKIGLTLTADNKSIEYGKNPPKYSFVSNGLVNGETIESINAEVTVSCAYEKGNKVDNYDIEINCSPLTNYNVTLVKGALEVSKISLTINVKSMSSTYGDKVPTYDCTFVGLDKTNANEEDLVRNGIKFVCEYAQGSKAGTYTVTAQVTLDNYNATVVDGQLTVNKKDVTVTASAEKTKIIYGESAPKYTYTISGLVLGESVSDAFNKEPVLSCGYNTSDPNNRIVKDYSIVASGLVSDNYNVKYVNGTLKVIKKELVLTPIDQTIQYGDAAPKASADTIKAEGLQYGEILPYTSIGLFITNSETVQSYKKGDKIGSNYDISLGTYATNNYYVVYKNARLTVEPRELKVRVLPMTIVYGDEIKEEDVKLVFEGFYGREDERVLNFDGMQILGYTAGNSVDKKYGLRVEGITSENYNIVCEDVGEQLTVIKRDLSITIRAYDDIKANPWSHAISVSDAKTHITISNLYEFDAINGTLATDSGEFGSYIFKGETLGGQFSWAEAISISRNDVSTLDNYNVSYDLQVEIGTYGMLISEKETYYDGNAHTLSVESFYENAEVLFGTEEGNYIYDINAIPNFAEAGSYTIYYKIWDKSGVLTGELCASKVINIKKRPVEIVAEDLTITYGEVLPTTYNYTIEGMGFLDGDGIEVLEGELQINSNYEYKGKVGQYAIVASGLTSANYDVIFVDGELIVDKRELTVKAINKNMTYGDDMPEFTVTYNGFADGESYEGLGGLTVTFDCIYANSKRAGEFEIIPVFEQEWDNYYLIADSGTLKVAKKAMSLRADNKTIVYGDEAPSFTASSSDFVPGDDLSSMTSVTYSTKYEKGSDVGTYTISIKATSDKYEITALNGSLKVNKKSVAVDWVGINTSYTYDSTDRTGAITASYKSVIDGSVITATITFGKKSTVFLTAGEYSVTATPADGNYTLTNAVQTVTMQKADYTSASHKDVTGVYDPNTTLKSYRLNTNYFWTYEDNVPNCVDKNYSAYYNADPENYNNFYFDIIVELKKASIGLSAFNTTIVPNQVVEADYNGNKFDITPKIYYQDMVVPTAHYTLTFTKGYEFTPGTYKTVMYFSADNYQMESDSVTYYVKYKSVKIGANGKTLYTIEDALNIATSGNIVIVTTDTNFGERSEVGAYLYNSDSYYTVKSGVTMLLPFNKDDTKGYIPGGEQGDNNYDSHPEDKSEKVLYITMNIPSSVTLNVKGTLTVGAVTNAKKVLAAHTGDVVNDVNGNYSVINLSGDIIVDSGKLNAYGYIRGSGMISTNGSALITENLIINGWMGGTISAARFSGGYKVGAGTLIISPSTITDDDFGHDPGMFPFNDYSLEAITVKMSLNYGSTWRGYIKISTSAQELAGMEIVNEKISETYLTLASSNANDDSSGMYRMMNSGSKIIKTSSNGRMRLELLGDITDGYSALEVGVLKVTINMSSRKVFFPVTKRTDVVVSGVFTQRYKNKYMPGSTLTISEGATYNLNGSIITYEKGFVDVAIGATYGTFNDNSAYVMVKGTMNINGAFGGDIYATETGKVNVSSSAVTTVTSREGTGTQAREGVSVVFTFVENGTVTRTMRLKNADGTSVQGTAGKNYSYANGSWS